MPRDSTETKNLLLDHAERLFAERGIWAVTNREITEAAGQKNVSALNYHFGSRGHLLGAVLARRGVELDMRRSELAVGLDASSATWDLVNVLVEVYAECLRTEAGRNYVRVVDQLRAGLTDWRTGASSDDVHLQRVLEILEQRPSGVPADVRSQRLVAMMMLMTGMTATRAQHLADDREVQLDHVAFVLSLTDILVGVVEAPCLQPAGS